MIFVAVGVKYVSKQVLYMPVICHRCQDEISHKQQGPQNHQFIVKIISDFIFNKRAQRALGRSPEEKVKGQGEAIILL